MVAIVFCFCFDGLTLHLILREITIVVFRVLARSSTLALTVYLHIQLGQCMVDKCHYWFALPYKNVTFIILQT